MKAIIIILLLSLSLGAFSQDKVIRYQIDSSQTRVKLADGEWGTWQRNLKMDKEMNMFISIDGANHILAFTTQFKVTSPITHYYKIISSVFDKSKESNGFTFLDLKMNSENETIVNWTIVTHGDKQYIITVAEIMQEKYFLKRAD